MPISPRGRLRLEDLIIRHFRDEGNECEEARVGGDRVLVFYNAGPLGGFEIELNITGLAERLLIEGLVDA